MLIGDIVELEKVDGTWNKVIKPTFPCGHLSFNLRACFDTLPHPLNLWRWKIQGNSKCTLCISPTPTTAHILNGFQSTLQQDRYTRCHNSVHYSIFVELKPFIPSGCDVYTTTSCRLMTMLLHTIPPCILSTALCPEMHGCCLAWEEISPSAGTNHSYQFNYWIANHPPKISIFGG